MSENIIKYNKWGKRKPVVYSNFKEFNRIKSEICAMNISDAAQSALLFNKLYGHEGLEFVLFSNSKMENEIIFPNGLIIKPCFLSTTNNLNINEPLVCATILMEKSSRYIYDCWLPITKWDEKSIDNEIRKIDETIAVFSLINTVSNTWEAKYSSIQKPKSTLHITGSEIIDVLTLSSKSQELEGNDKIAFFRSLTWLKRAESIDDIFAKFLFCMFSIESLVGYIENEIEDSSTFKKFQTEPKTKQEKDKERITLINKALDDDFEKKPIKAIVNAYFNGVVPIKSTLKKHLNKVFKNNLIVLEQLFEPKDNSLYDLRSKIAHGKTDLIDEIEKKEVYIKSYEIEKIAREYLWRILEIKTVQKTMHATMNLNMQDGIISRDEMYDGPTDMAVLYNF